MPATPTPQDAEDVLFFIKWYQEILGGIILMLTAWYMKSKGKSSAKEIIPMSEEEIEHRMTICKQSILIAMNELMQKHEARENHQLEERDKRLLEHIKDLLNNK